MASKSVAGRKVRNLQDLLGQVEPREKAVRATLIDVEKEILELPKSADTAIEKATEYFDHLMALLQDRKEEVVKEIGSRRQEAAKSLETQKEQIEFELAGLTEFREQQALGHGNEVEGQARQRVEELLTTPADLTARPSHVVFSEGTAVAKFGDAVAKAGCVGFKAKVEASKCSVEVKPAVVKYSNVALLTTADLKGRPCVVPKDDVTATLTDPSGQAVPTQLQEKGKGKGLWEISYTPEVKGNYRLEVKVKSRPVAGSPYDVSVQSRDIPVLTIGGKGELSKPTDVAVDMDCNIAVLEVENKRVQIFDAKTGQSLRCFPVDTYGEDHWGIAVDQSNGQFIVTCGNTHVDTDKQAILVYSREGELRKTIKPDCLKNPRGVAVLKDGRMVVLDNMLWNTTDKRRQHPKSCLLLKPDGKIIKQIGKEQLYDPWFIAVDESRGLLYVTDYLLHKVFVFDLEGNWKFSFGKEGQGKGEFINPSGIALHPAGFIVVVDNAYNNHLQLFRPDRECLRVGTLAKVSQPRNLRGIALTRDGHIAVACYSRQCVELYRCI